MCQEKQRMHEQTTNTVGLCKLRKTQKSHDFDYFSCEFVFVLPHSQS